jgi:hypothetical protein
MKRIITKFWGVGLILMLLSTLFMAATPVSAADALMWNYKFDTPGGGSWGLAPGTDIRDFAVSADGMTIYASANTTSANYLLQTTSGAAAGWSDITSRLPTAGVTPGVTEFFDIDSVDYVALAPDDPNVVVVVDSTANATDHAAVAVSTNGGSTFSTMGFVGTDYTVFSGVSVSPIVTGGYRYIAVFGRDTNTKLPVLWYYNYGAGVGGWQEAVYYFGTGTPVTGVYMSPVPATQYTTGTQADIVAMQFSPNFPSDQMAVALSAERSDDTPGAGEIYLHVMSFNSLKWDDPVATGYPVLVTSAPAAATVFNVASASLALLPDYDGGDESLRIEFVGASINPAAELGGIWRLYDTSAGKIWGGTTPSSGIGINSVAFDGTNLAAGAFASNIVYRAADPLVTSPTFLTSRNLKKIGVDDAFNNDRVIVKFAGATLLGAKQGADSAMSKSLDYGNVWNDFTLIDSGNNPGWLGNPAMQVFIAPGTTTDTYMSATGDPWYLAANDGTTTSVYRMSHFAMQKVLSIPGVYSLILRGISSDPGVVYAAAVGGTDLYYTADGGLTRWYKRITPAAVADMAVEDASVVYVGQGVNVYKSTNNGFTWGTPVNCKFSTGVINTMLSLGANNLLVGGTTGGVGYSTDGGATWTQTLGTAMVLGGGAGPVALAATGLGPTDYIFAADLGSNTVMRITGADMGVFENMNMPAGATGAKNTGMVLQSGVLYVLSSNTTKSFIDRTLAPTFPVTHPDWMWGTRYTAAYNFAPAAANIPPSALRVSSGAPGSIMLYAVDQSWWPVAYYLEDNIALSGPKVTGPADKSTIEMNTMNGNPYNVNLTWSRISKATAYGVMVSLDPTFTSLIGPPYPATSSMDAVSLIIPNKDLQPGTTYYWVVYATSPLYSAWSEVRSFTVKPGAAAVPNIASPLNGGTIESTKPAFSWSPVSGATMYQFQLSEGTAFAAPVYDTQVANAGVQLPLTVTLEQGKTYFWRVRALQPIQGDWSTIANFTVAEPAPVVVPTPPVVIQQMPAPVINIPAAPPATVVQIPPAPAEKVINPTYIWAIIIIGAVLVIAVIVLIVRTRRSV